MDPGLVEMVFSFGVVLAFGVWQLNSLEKAMKRTREKAAKRAALNDHND